MFDEQLKLAVSILHYSVLNGLPAGCFCTGCSINAVTPITCSRMFSCLKLMYLPSGRIFPSHHSMSGTKSSCASLGVINASLVADEIPVFFATAAISF